MDISNLTYKELENLEGEIKKRKEEIEKTKYKFFVGGVLNAINELEEAGFEDTVCFYDSDGCSWTWADLMVGISDVYERRKRED